MPRRAQAPKTRAKRPLPTASSGREGDPCFFEEPASLRRWLESNHASVTELWVGYHKRDTGRPSVTWPQSVGQALCFGWIDGVRKSIDGGRYKIRFTPRKARSSWSAANVNRFAELTRDGLVSAAGAEAFAARDTTRSYSYESRTNAELSAEQRRTFRSNARAWDFFSARPPSYRKATTWWVVSAKRPETQVKRLAAFIACCADERLLPQLTPYPKR